MKRTLLLYMALLVVPDDVRDGQQIGGHQCYQEEQ